MNFHVPCYDLGMVEKDAIQEIDDALVDVKKYEGALDRLKAAVRRAHDLGYPLSKIAARTGYHANTIAYWCGRKRG